ncbi:uncharacterized protein LOC124857001 [Girardinichthys multiradiatus]|uniref:uncharacterized protein LOC124857001 n=1 Tax=Girardinichthys multiradiatus TaxID=208333 RepID=UPI001FAC99A1|nr:uncharacterized protein LOC124857001 [Girardinichthys multiradiatus]
MYKPQFSFLPGTNHLRLHASSEAAAAALQERKASSRGKQPVKSTQEVEVVAQGRVRALGGDPTDPRCILSQMEVQFGLYRGHTFQWLLTHDLGYTAGLLASHVAEREAGHSSSSPLLCNKDALLEYAQLFDEVAAAIVDKRRTLIGGTDSEGDRLVGFSEYSSVTYRELYESSDPQISSDRRWIRGMQVQHAGSRLSQGKTYVLRRDRAQQPAASSVASTPSPAACSSRADSQASCTTRALSPSPQHQPSIPRKKRAMVIYSSSGEGDELMVEAASAVEQELSPSASSSAEKPSASAAQVVPFESWKSSLPREQQEWLSKALFVKDWTGRAVLSNELQLWYHPPGPRLIYSQRPSSPDAFFQRPFFLWAPYRIWQYSLKCPSCTHKLTSCGLYKTVRRVLDLDGWYYMGTEYLECRYCTKKVAAWSRSVREQLDYSHQLLFPAELAYRLSCDKKVLSQMKGRTLGNSANRLHSFLVKNHTEEWMSRCLLYLETCGKFQVAGVHLAPTAHPLRMQPVPTSGWLLSAYARETFSQMEELQASVTSIFGSILKMESTKKVIKKLAGVDDGTAQWMSSVGNELGQVLICVVTAGEGYGLQDMAMGLQKRYELARRTPPEVLYVDRDCCRADGDSGAAAPLFASWPLLEIRLDIWHFIRRLAAGVTAESHPLYPDFMQRISASIFEWDTEDVSRLKRAKQAEQSRRGTVQSAKEMARHCRRRTRGAQETGRLLSETIHDFMGATDTMNIPLLDQARMEDIWRTQRKHVACIQDPLGVQMYTRTGQVTKGGVVLPVYRCARGSKSLESFHLHLNRFIPGTSASGCHFQMYLLEGLARWNEERAQAVVGAEKMGMKCYVGKKQHSLFQLTQRLLGVTLLESYSKPLKYTGELIGMSYLYAQTGQELQIFPDDPDEPDGSEEIVLEDDEESEEDRLLDVLGEDLDEGFSELAEDPLGPSLQTPPFQPPSAPAISSSGHTPPHSLQGTSGDQEVAVGPDGTPGYQHVVRLARKLVELCSKGYISNAEVEKIVGLWQNLPEVDKGPIAFPSRYKDSLNKGMKRCVAGSGPASWPDASRLVEAIFKELCALYPGSRRVEGAVISQWTLVLRDYNSIRNVVLSHPALKTRTTLQLFAVNQSTLSQWYRKLTAIDERTTLMAGVAPLQAPTEAKESLLPAKELQEPQPVPSTSSVFRNLQPLETREKEARAGPSETPSISAPSTSSSTQDAAPPLPTTAHATAHTTHVPKSTAWNRKKIQQLQEAAAKEGVTLKVRAPSINICRHCGIRKIRQTGHRLLMKASGERVNYCPMAAKGQRPEEWLASL